MKILFVISLPSSFSSIASAFSRINFFAKDFSQKGNRVVVSGVFNPFDRRNAKIDNHEGIKFINIIPFIPKLNGFSFIFNIISLVFISWIPYALIRPDVVIISVPPGESGLSYFLFAKIFRVSKIIFDYRDEWEDYALRNAKKSLYKYSYSLVKYLMNKCYRNSNAIITVTEPLESSLRARKASNIFVIPNGADISIFNPVSNQKEKSTLRQKFEIEANDFVLIYCGIIGEYYDLSIVIHSLSVLRDKIPNLKFVILGTGTDLQKILDLIKQLDLEDIVIYLGEKSNKTDVSQILKIADVGLIPYDDNPLWKNSLPAKGFEYLACGLPILSTVSQDSVLGKLIVTNKVGMICESINYISFSEIIERIYLDSDFINSAREKSVFLVRDKFDRNKLANDFLKIIEDLQ